MHIFEEMAACRHYQLVFWSEPEAGYRGIIAIHDTTLGPALGGTRLWTYASEADALTDALRLARGMTYKAAIAGLKLGGGKSVILADERQRDRERLFRAHGRAVESLGGRYITAEDVGTSVDDMEFVRAETRWVAGVRGGSGDPSPATAHGVYQGIRACARERYGDPCLEGRHVTVQGVGHVGYQLCAELAAEGARLTIADINPGSVECAVREFGATAVAAEAIYDVPADIFAPCALGGVINDRTVARLRVDIVAGSANNQLAEPRHGDALQKRGILFAPDYVINAGGLINVYGELHGWSVERTRRKAAGIYDVVLNVFQRAREDAITAAEASNRVALQILTDARRPGSAEHGSHARRAVSMST
ncbi:MAG: Glu/Leu/Phe/Val dehydrogenase [Gammaproteobacteria bacterium]|nr:Glu/Leu/Phe/Val dehydrogenase [Gammaproteobacteria bacterium]